MILYVASIMIVFSIALIVYAAWPKKSDKSDAIKRRMTGKSARSAVDVARQVAQDSVTKRVMKSVAPIAVRSVLPTNAEQMSKLRMRLSTAGFRSDSAPMIFLASKTVVAIALGLAAVAFTIAKGIAFQNAAGAVLLAAGVGFLAPDFWLRMAITKRTDQIRKGLPDTLDMLVISVESGLGLDAAIQRVAEEMQKVHMVLASEMHLVTLESQMGLPRSEALSNFAARTAIDETQSMVGVISQAERFGTSIAGALRRQSETLRVKRRQAAEERAQKTTVKLMAPLILFIFPAILVVLGGPAALKMIDALGF